MTFGAEIIYAMVVLFLGRKIPFESLGRMMGADVRLNPNSATCQVCYLGQVTQLTWASVFPNKSYCGTYRSG